MNRYLLVACLLAAATSQAAAVPLLGDFECLSDFGGPDSYHGTMRVEEYNFGFLNEGAAIQSWYEVNLTNPDAVLFDNAFAEHISAGATVVSAREITDETSYSVVIRTKKGDETVVTCIYVY